MSVPKEFWIRKMVCNCCLKVIKQELQELGVIFLSLERGKLLVEAQHEIDNANIDKVTNVFSIPMVFKLYRVKLKCL